MAKTRVSSYLLKASMGRFGDIESRHGPVFRISFALFWRPLFSPPRNFFLNSVCDAKDADRHFPIATSRPIASPLVMEYGELRASLGNYQPDAELGNTSYWRQSAHPSRQQKKACLDAIYRWSTKCGSAQGRGRQSWPSARWGIFRGPSSYCPRPPLPVSLLFPNPPLIIRDVTFFCTEQRNPSLSAQSYHVS